MTFNRRNFVQGATCLAAAAPTFANLFFLLSSEQSNALVVAEPLPEPEAEVQTASINPLFKIHGWESRHNIGVEQSRPAAHISEAVNDDRAVIRVMQSWRTAWR
jgi:hypothetical protein